MIELAYTSVFLFLTYISFCAIISEARSSPYKEIFPIICLILNIRFYYFFIPIFAMPDKDSKILFLAQLLKSYFTEDNILLYSNISLVFLTLYTYYYYIRNNLYNQYHWFVVYDYVFYIQYWYFMLYLPGLSWIFCVILVLYELTIIKICIHFKFLHESSEPFIFLVVLKVFLWFFFPQIDLEDILILFIEKAFPFIFTAILSIVYLSLMAFFFDNSASNFSRIQVFFILPSSMKGNIKIKSISLLASDYLIIFVIMYAFTGVYLVFIYNVYGEVSGLAFALVAFGISTPSAYSMSLSLVSMQRKYLIFNMISLVVVLITVKELV